MIDQNEEQYMKDMLHESIQLEKEKLEAYLIYMEHVEQFVSQLCPHCHHSPCWWKSNKGDLQEWCIYHIGEENVWEDMLAKWCRRQLTREINRRWYGPKSNLLKPLPVCMRIGVFRTYLPFHLKKHLWDPQFWGQRF